MRWGYTVAMSDIAARMRESDEAGAPCAAFVDIDGTLCDSRQRVPASALEALQRVRRRGHRLFACTGRSAPEVYPRFWDAGFEGLVGGAGGYAAVGERVLVDERMPGGDVEALTALWEDLSAFYVWQGPDQMGPSEGYLDFFVPRAGAHPKDWVEYAHSISPYIVDVARGSFTKVTAYVAPELACLDRVRACLPPGYRVIVGSVGAAGYVPFEVIPAHLSKAVGIRAVCDYLDIPIARTVAIGDSSNDVEAVECAGIGIAIGRECGALLDVADIVAPTVNEDGLAWALDRCGLSGC